MNDFFKSVWYFRIMLSCIIVAAICVTGQFDLNKPTMQQYQGMVIMAVLALSMVFTQVMALWNRTDELAEANIIIKNLHGKIKAITQVAAKEPQEPKYGFTRFDDDPIK